MKDIASFNIWFHESERDRQRHLVPPLRSQLHELMNELHFVETWGWTHSHVRSRSIYHQIALLIDNLFERH